MTVAVVLLALLPGAWLLLRRARRRPRTHLQVAASSLWTLDHICISLGVVLREWPELREIRLSVAQLSKLDDASIASLQSAIQTAARARVRFRLEGYDVSMARLALASGIDAQHLGAPRAAATRPRATLH